MTGPQSRGVGEGEGSKKDARLGAREPVSRTRFGGGPAGECAPRALEAGADAEEGALPRAPGLSPRRPEDARSAREQVGDAGTNFPETSFAQGLAGPVRPEPQSPSGANSRPPPAPRPSPWAPYRLAWARSWRSPLLRCSRLLRAGRRAHPSFSPTPAPGAGRAHAPCAPPPSSEAGGGRGGRSGRGRGLGARGAARVRWREAGGGRAELRRRACALRPPPPSRRPGRAPDSQTPAAGADLCSDFVLICVTAYDPALPHFRVYLQTGCRGAGMVN